MTTDPMMLLRVRDLKKSFPGAPPVLLGASLDIARGETVALTGESGSGKSTFLTLVSGLDAPDSGSINIDGTELCGQPDSALAALRRSMVGLVFQQFNLIPSLPVSRNISFQARLAGTEDTNWTAEVTDRLGLGDLTTRYPEQLSGGQQQRVAIARTLAARPRLILADEPTGNLDEDTSTEVLALMLEATTRSGAALLMVTHSSRLAGLLSRQVHLSHGVLS